MECLAQNLKNFNLVQLHVPTSPKPFMKLHKYCSLPGRRGRFPFSKSVPPAKAVLRRTPTQKGILLVAVTISAFISPRIPPVSLPTECCFTFCRGRCIDIPYARLGFLSQDLHGREAPSHRLTKPPDNHPPKPVCYRKSFCTATDGERYHKARRESLPQPSLPI